MSRGEREGGCGTEGGPGVKGHCRRRKPRGGFAPAAARSIATAFEWPARCGYSRVEERQRRPAASPAESFMVWHLAILPSQTFQIIAQSVSHMAPVERERKR